MIKRRPSEETPSEKAPLLNLHHWIYRLYGIKRLPTEPSLRRRPCLLRYSPVSASVQIISQGEFAVNTFLKFKENGWKALSYPGFLITQDQPVMPELVTY
jgi:hypothetical protein